MQERWKKVKGYEGIYWVSNKGRVKSKRTVLKPIAHSRGYLTVKLYGAEKPANRYVHRLVAIAFCPNPNGKPEVNHKDGNKKNNIYTNIEWATSSENSKHAHDMGLAKSARGSSHVGSKLVESQVIEIRMMWEMGPKTIATQEKLGRMYGVSASTISNIVYRRKWKHV